MVEHLLTTKAGEEPSEERQLTPQDVADAVADILGVDQLSEDRIKRAMQDVLRGKTVLSAADRAIAALSRWGSISQGDARKFLAERDIPLPPRR